MSLLSVKYGSICKFHIDARQFIIHAVSLFTVIESNRGQEIAEISIPGHIVIIDMPKQECSNRIVKKDRVSQLFNLLHAPYILSLERRHYVLAIFYILKSLINRNAAVN